MSTKDQTETPTSIPPPILAGLHACLPPPLLSRILTSRILLIGSGGIGCELLKNLALSGFRHVEVIDLDTIDVSNLNRQFLFRSRHVGMAKCKVASEAALCMVPPMEGSEATYQPHHGNVLDNTRFNVPYVQSFSLVLNALDNITARRRVNRLCLAASIPLIEAGTAGYLGQVTVIDKNAGVECYECQAKPTQKVYPICTIRSTPSMPVHCIVWAKELYKLCFGGKVEESMLFEDEESLRAEKEGNAEDEADKSGETDGKTDGEKSTDASTNPDPTTQSSGGEKSTYMDLVHQLRSLLGIGSSTPQSNDDNFESSLRQAAQQALTALFVTEINKQIGMNRYKTAEKVPVPISTEDLEKCTDADEVAPTQRKRYQPTEIWSPADCLVETISCFLQVANSTTPPLPEFDKDDEMAMRFVTAASNLRSYVFQIEPIQSLYDAKGIAGNIIPAIATTNAIVAGLQVLQAFHILKCQWMHKENEEVGGEIKKLCRYTYCLREKTRKGYLLQPTTLPAPNPNCFVCRNAIISLALNTKEWTLEMLLSRVIKKELGFSQPTLLVGGDIVYEEGDDIDPSEYVTNLSKKLINLPSGGVGHGSVFGVEDFSQDLEVEVSLSHKDEWFITVEDDGQGGKKGLKPDDREESEKFEIGGKKPTVAAANAPSADAKVDAGESAKEIKDQSDDDNMEIIESNGNDAQMPPAENGNNTKGTAEDDDSDIEILEVSPADAAASTEGTGESRMPLKKRRLSLNRGSSDGDGAKKSKVGDTAASGSGEVEVIELDSD